jgi:antitoxin CptB
VIAVTQAADIGPTAGDGAQREHPVEEGRRLLWGCRRGMKELDVLLERYARAVLPSAAAGERRAFAELLELPDPTLAGYLLGGEVPAQAHLAGLVRRIRA